MVPTLVTGLLKTNSVVQVAAGTSHTLCLTADGLVLVCGYGGRGQLGVGDTKDRVVPTLVRGELEGRLNSAASRCGFKSHMCVTEDGAVFAFGSNYHGHLGVGDTDNRLVPTLLRGELEDKSDVQVAAGFGHTMFVTADGLVFSCGNNGMGQLGVGDTDDRLVPTLVTGQLQGKAALYAALGIGHAHVVHHSRWLVIWMGRQCHRTNGCWGHRGQTGTNAGCSAAGQASGTRRSRQLSHNLHRSRRLCVHLG